VVVSCCAQMAVPVMTGPALSFPARSGPDRQRASRPEPPVVADVGQDQGQSLVEHFAADAPEQPGHEHPLDAAELGVLPGQAGAARDSLEDVGDHGRLVGLLVAPVVAQQRGLVDGKDLAPDDAVPLENRILLLVCGLVVASGGSAVFVDQAAQYRFSVDSLDIEVRRGHAGKVALAAGDSLVDALMRPGHVVVRLVPG